MDAAEIQHEFIYVDEAGFNLAKTRRRGRNVIGHRAITNVPGQRGGNITLCAAITQNGVLHHHANLGPYNANLILAFLHRLHEIVTALNQVDQMLYTRRFFQRCLANEDIACDVDEILWPDPARRRDDE